MSLLAHGMVRCDICGQTQPEAVLRLEHWRRLFYANDLGIPEHACSAGCALIGLRTVNDHKRALEAKHRPTTMSHAPLSPPDLRTRYAPPYDSPIEDELARHLDKYLAPTVAIVPQHPVETLAGRFRLDFALHAAGQRWGLECDGAEFHDSDRDEWRDAMILATGEVDAIFRFQGKDLVYRATDCVALLAGRLRGLFSAAGLLNLETLTPELGDTSEDNEPPRPRVQITALSRADLHRQRPPFWKAYIDFAVERGPAPLEQLMAEWKASQAATGLF